jgi:hypothetical protein
VRERTVELRDPADCLLNDNNESQERRMFHVVRLAGLSAVLAAAFVLATGMPPATVQSDLRPTLVVAFE